MSRTPAPADPGSSSAPAPAPRLLIVSRETGIGTGIFEVEAEGGDATKARGLAARLSRAGLICTVGEERPGGVGVVEIARYLSGEEVEHLAGCQPAAGPHPSMCAYGCPVATMWNDEVQAALRAEGTGGATFERAREDFQHTGELIPFMEAAGLLTGADAPTSSPRDPEELHFLERLSVAVCGAGLGIGKFTWERDHFDEAKRAGRPICPACDAWLPPTFAEQAAVGAPCVAGDIGGAADPVEAARLEVVRLLSAAEGWDHTLSEICAAPLTLEKVLDAIEAASSVVMDGDPEEDTTAGAAADIAALAGLGRLLTAFCERGVSATMAFVGRAPCPLVDVSTGSES